MTGERTSVIELRSVRHLYGKSLALRAERLTIDTSTTLVGRNGAGKSTLLLIVAGLLAPSEGKVTVGGDPVGTADARRRVSFVPDIPALFDDLSLGDQMRYVARLHGGRRAGPAPAATSLVDLLDAGDLLDRLPVAMSKGQRQKASLLVATARPCTVLLADEPTTGLDEESRLALLDGFDHLRQEGMLVVSSTHDKDLIDRTGHRLHLEKGHVVTDDPDDPDAADDA